MKVTFPLLATLFALSFFLTRAASALPESESVRFHKYISRQPSISRRVRRMFSQRFIDRYWQSLQGARMRREFLNREVEEDLGSRSEHPVWSEASVREFQTDLRFDVHQNEIDIAIEKFRLTSDCGEALEWGSKTGQGRTWDHTSFYFLMTIFYSAFKIHETSRLPVQIRGWKLHQNPQLNRTLINIGFLIHFPQRSQYVSNSLGEIDWERSLEKFSRSRINPVLTLRLVPIDEPVIR